jgi:inhibitor of KinA
MNVTTLGDQCALFSFPTEDEALRFSRAAGRLRPDWLVDVVAAYFTVAVYFDLRMVCYREVVEQCRRLPLDWEGKLPPSERTLDIPCCYDYGLDLERIAGFAGVTPGEVIALHSSAVYTVYAIGFCPGFPYLGYLPKALCNVPRLPSPRVRVEPGSVGLTGRQTGIYTEARPGGWNILGRTPFELVDVADAYFPIRPGDRVRFVPIDGEQFAELRGQRISS